MTKRTPEFNSFNNAKQRCTNPKHPRYPDWGGRGIKFLLKSFKEFIEHVGNKPSKEYSLDRIDNFGNYELGNIQWSHPKKQNMNQRIRKDNTTGFPGIVFDSQYYRWSATIRGKRYYYGPSFGDALATRILLLEKDMYASFSNR